MKHVTITIDFDVNDGLVTNGFITGAVKGEILNLLCLENRTEAKNLKVRTKIIKDKAI